MQSFNPLAVLTDYVTKAVLDEKISPAYDCPTYRLSEVFHAKKGVVPAELSTTFNENAKPYINIKAFEQGIIEHYVESEDGVAVSAKDLLIVWDGARCGLVGQGKDGILGSTLKKLTLKEEFSSVPLTYMRHFIQSHYRVLNTNSRGSVIQHVDPSIFWKLQIPIPAQDDERFRRICTLVKAMDQVELQLKQQVALVKDMKHSFLHEAFRPRKEPHFEHHL